MTLSVTSSPELPGAERSPNPVGNSWSWRSLEVAGGRWRPLDRPGPDWKTLVRADGNVPAATVREDGGKAVKHLSGGAENNGTTVTQQNCYQLRCHGNKATAGPRSNEKWACVRLVEAFSSKVMVVKAYVSSELVFPQIKSALNLLIPAPGRSVTSHVVTAGAPTVTPDLLKGHDFVERGIKDPFRSPGSTAESTTMNNGPD